MILLTRQIRCFWPGHAPATGEAGNRWATLTPTSLWQPYLVVELTVTGEPCPTSGYIINIRQLDDWTQQHLTHLASQWPASPTDPSLASQLPARIGQHVGHCLQQSHLSQIHLASCRVSFSPQLDFRWRPLASQPSNKTDSKNMPGQISLTQQFEFSAAHRLHCEQWTEEENRRVFGKCNYPTGHGHNYLLNVTIRRTDQIDPQQSDLPWLDHWVRSRVLEKVDHRFLNHDVPEFGDRNPTVENISQVVFGWLNHELPAEYEIENVRVFETAKTWADCRP